MAEAWPERCRTTLCFGAGCWHRSAVNRTEPCSQGNTPEKRGENRRRERGWRSPAVTNFAGHARRHAEICRGISQASLYLERRSKRERREGLLGFYRGSKLRRGLGFGAGLDRTAGRHRAGTRVSARAWWSFWRVGPTRQWRGGHSRCTTLALKVNGPWALSEAEPNRSPAALFLFPIFLIFFSVFWFNSKSFCKFHSNEFKQSYKLFKHLLQRFKPVRNMLSKQNMILGKSLCLSKVALLT
jgi:hypothetical protein